MTAPKVDSYRFGHLVVDGTTFKQDVLVLPDGVRAGWWRREGHRLHPDDLADVFAVGPEVLVVGQGASGLLAIPEETRRVVQQAGIELFNHPTEKACHLYNELSRQRRTVAALHLTC
ncbi:MAG: MTH938/NDUFAF3 family protein [Desulfurivibrio sp.]|nr:MTH938/NDUFAF3 family protein [Desulfurivibrio sp.]